MTSHTVLVSDSLGAAGMARLAAESDVEVIDGSGLDRAGVLAAAARADALIVRSGTTVDLELFEAAPNLRVVGRAGVGVDNVDLDAATRRGVMVVNTPRANTVATAEQTMALMLAATRCTAAAHRSLAEGKWDRKSFTGVDLAGRTLGVVGFGRIGREVAARARAFGMEVIAFDPYVSEVIGRDHSVLLVEFDELLEQADVVTLHAIPPADGSALIGADEIASMRPGGVIVNAARGQLLDAAAACAALDADHLRAVAVDVFDVEPPPPDHPLVGHPRVVHTPHLGASTIEAQRDVSLQVADEVLAGLRGETMSSCVNVPFLFDTETEAQLGLAEAMGRVQRAMADGPITQVDVEVSDDRDELLPMLAAGVLAGVLHDAGSELVNFVSAPAIAEEHGIKVTQGRGLGTRDYPNLMSCRVSWGSGSRIVSGVVFGGKEPRIVQVSDYQLDARPEGTILLMLNEDLPGVVGEVGTLLGEHGVNIAEWRLGRSGETGLALSFINLDAMADDETMQALRGVAAVQKAEVLRLD